MQPVEVSAGERGNAVKKANIADVFWRGRASGGAKTACGGFPLDGTGAKAPSFFSIVLTLKLMAEELREDPVIVLRTVYEVGELLDRQSNQKKRHAFELAE